MDNFQFDITSDGNLEQWLTLCMSHNRRSVGYIVDKRVSGPDRLIFFWTEPEANERINVFPGSADAKLLSAIIQSWLDEVPYGGQPDHDGSNKKGFRLYNEAWGHIGSHREAFLAVEPAWALYGK